MAEAEVVLKLKIKVFPASSNTYKHPVAMMGPFLKRRKRRAAAAKKLGLGRSGIGIFKVGDFFANA